MQLGFGSLKLNRPKERGTYLGEAADGSKPRQTAAGMGARAGSLGLISADGTRPRDWPQSLDCDRPAGLGARLSLSD